MKILSLGLGLFTIQTAVQVAQSKPLVGADVGGWFVLEPWITPSLFYRFLDMNQTGNSTVGIDSYTLCESLGPEEGNKLMRAHWDAWIDEDYIKMLKEREIEILRLPIGDWTLDPYGPYVGCMDGVEDKIQWFFDTCARHNISILLDVHGLKGSQNGFDNSGQTHRVMWSENGTYFDHWSYSTSEWSMNFDNVTNTYGNFNYLNVQQTLKRIEKLLIRWGTHSQLYAFEPANEPLNYNSLLMTEFLRSVRKMMKRLAPQAYLVFHDGFISDGDYWDSVFPDDDMDKIALDHHAYAAFENAMYTVEENCAFFKGNAEKSAKTKYELWIGEWSLATDECAMWLSGFNTGGANPSQQHPKYECQWVDCPNGYLPDEFKFELDKSKDVYGPFGGQVPQEYVTIQKGMCSTDSQYFSHKQVQQLATCILDTYDQNADATFFWTSRNEIEAKWDYVRAYDLGWLNRTQTVQEVDASKMFSVNPLSMNSDQVISFLN